MEISQGFSMSGGVSKDNSFAQKYWMLHNLVQFGTIPHTTSVANESFSSPRANKDMLFPRFQLAYVFFYSKMSAVI